MYRILMDWVELGCRNGEESLMTPNVFLGNLINDGSIH